VEDAEGGGGSDYCKVNNYNFFHVVLKISRRRIGVQPSREGFNWKKLWIASPRRKKYPVKDKNTDE